MSDKTDESKEDEDESVPLVAQVGAGISYIGNKVGEFLGANTDSEQDKTDKPDDETNDRPITERIGAQISYIGNKVGEFLGANVGHDKGEEKEKEGTTPSVTAGAGGNL